jgi:hypothetical protein
MTYPSSHQRGHLKSTKTQLSDSPRWCVTSRLSAPYSVKRSTESAVTGPLWQRRYTCAETTVQQHSGYTERSIPPLVVEETLLLKTYKSRIEHKSWSWIATRPEAKAQQQLNRPIDISSCSEGVTSQRGQVPLGAEAVKIILVESR